MNIRDETLKFILSTNNNHKDFNPIKKLNTEFMSLTSSDQIIRKLLRFKKLNKDLKIQIKSKNLDAIIDNNQQ